MSPAPSRRTDAAEQQALERLVLAEWPTAADAHVVGVTVVGERAEVALTLGGHYEYWVYFMRDDDGQWREYTSANGASVGWADVPPDTGPEATQP